jgi:hypothetical protein
VTGYSTRCSTCGARVLRLPDWQDQPVKLEPQPRARGEWALRPMLLGGGHYADRARDGDTQRYGVHVCKRKKG